MEIGQVFYLLQDGERDDAMFVYGSHSTSSCYKGAKRFNTPNEAREWAELYECNETFGRDFKVKKYVVKDIWLEHVEHQTEGFDSEEAQILAASEPSKTEPIMLLRVGDTWSDDWIKRVYIDDDGDWRFDTCEHALDAKAFNDLHEVNAFLGDLPLNKVFIFVSRHDPKTRHIIGEGYIKTK